MATAKLPVTSFIEIQNNEAGWELLRKGLVDKPIQCSGKIEIPPPHEKKVIVNIVITKVIHSSDISSENRVTMHSNLGSTISKGLEQISKFFWDFCDSDCYTLLGYIDGENQIPIIIVWYAKFDFAIYVQKTKTQTVEEFFPKAINPRDN